MKVVEYLNNGGTLEKLKADHGIDAKVYPDWELILLNYHMLEARKDDAMASECRSLVLDFEYNVVSRGFDRFFNWEERKPPHKIENLVAHEKIDGSLITLFYHKGAWKWRTRGVVMPEQPVQGFEVSWEELILETIVRKGLSMYDRALSYIFELTTPENRVVVAHHRRSAVFLASRNNITGEYVPATTWIRGAFSLPKTHSFRNYAEVLEAAKALPNLEEGYVMYDSRGAPVSKIKNPAYVAAHHLKGDGFSKRRVMELVRTGEDMEYLAIFPEDSDFFRPFQDSWNAVCAAVAQLWEETRDLESQKEFALAVRQSPIAAVLFRMRKTPDASVLDVIETLTTNAKNAMMDKYLQLSDENAAKLIDGPGSVA